MAPAGFARPVGRPYEGEGTEPSPAPGLRRGLPRHGRADEDSETSVTSPVGAPLENRSGPPIPNPADFLERPLGASAPTEVRVGIYSRPLEISMRHAVSVACPGTSCFPG
jgi:hypothetical protein